MLKIKFFRDRQLIERIRKNDRLVLGEIYTKYEKQVFSYIKYKGGTEEDAKDMLQEAIIVLWQKVNSGDFNLSAQLSTFLIAVAKNQWRKELRKKSKMSNEQISENKSDENPGQLDTLLIQEKSDLVQKAFELIKPLCKKLLLLFYFEERNLEDITKILKFSNSNVTKSKKYQCKKSLELVLQQQFVEPERRMK